MSKNSSNITFVHTADVHFGVENYGKIDAKTGIHTRLLDFKKSFDEAVDAAIRDDVDFFLLCGDAYKTAYPTPTQQKLLMQSLLKLHCAKIPVVIVVGNHDNPLSFGKAHALDVFSYVPLSDFYVFSKPESIVITTKHGPVQIVGIPWPTRNYLVSNEAHHLKDHHEITSYISEKIGQLISSFADKLDPALPAVLCGHLTVTSGIFSGSEKCAIYGTDPVFLPSQLAIPPFDYVALGHLHRHQNLNEQGYPPLVYAGSIERVDFGERKEDKGFCHVTITHDEAGKKSCSYQFRTVNTRPMIQIEVHLNEQSSQTEQILQQIASYNVQDAIIKIVYHLPPGKADKVDLGAILHACNEAAHLVGVFPQQIIAPREKRTQLTVGMNFDTLLDQYFSGKKELIDKKELLIKKAHEVKNRLEQAEIHESSS